MRRTATRVACLREVLEAASEPYHSFLRRIAPFGFFKSQTLLTWSSVPSPKRLTTCSRLSIYSHKYQSGDVPASGKRTSSSRGGEWAKREATASLASGLPSVKSLLMAYSTSSGWLAGHAFRPLHLPECRAQPQVGLNVQ